MAVEIFLNPVLNFNSERHCSSIRSTDGEEYTVYCSFSNSVEGYIKVIWLKKACKLIGASCLKDAVHKNPCFSTSVLVRDQTEARLQIPYASTIILNIIPQLHLAKRQRVPSKRLENQPLEKTWKKLEQLSADMNAALETSSHFDVVLTDGLAEIRAHKVMLSARSPVFAKMFQHPMKENRENKITIPDIYIKVLEEMVRFMYSGTITIKDRTMALDLFVAADKYDIKGLRDICIDELLLVDSENVLDTLILANMYNNKNLREAALAFASKNYSQLKKHADWDAFKKEHETLAVELLSFVIDDKIAEL